MLFKSNVILFVLFCEGLMSLDGQHLTETDRKSERHSIAKPHIVGGATVGVLYYQVSLRYKPQPGIFTDAARMLHFCGGSLIRPNIVLTAAHCTVIQLHEDSRFNLAVGNKQIYAVAGTNLYHYERGTPIIMVEMYLQHPDYVDKKPRNDVAVLKLKSRFSIGPTVDLIKLRSSPPVDHTTCMVSGWGRTHYGSGNPGPEKLQAANVPIIPFQSCMQMYGYAAFLQLPRDMICAGYETGGVDSCQGDSGGPLVCDGLLTGIVSWGRECGTPKFPGVYSAVHFHKDWIEQAIEDLHGDPTSNVTGTRPIPAVDHSLPPFISDAKTLFSVSTVFPGLMLWIVFMTNACHGIGIP